MNDCGLWWKLSAAAKELATIVYAVLTKGEPYNGTFRGRLSETKATAVAPAGEPARIPGAPQHRQLQCEASRCAGGENLSQAGVLSSGWCVAALLSQGRPT